MYDKQQLSFSLRNRPHSYSEKESGSNDMFRYILKNCRMFTIIVVEALNTT